jgi:hypothetical protein
MMVHQSVYQLMVVLVDMLPGDSRVTLSIINTPLLCGLVLQEVSPMQSSLSRRLMISLEFIMVAPSSGNVTTVMHMRRG